MDDSYDFNAPQRVNFEENDGENFAISNNADGYFVEVASEQESKDDITNHQSENASSTLALTDVEEVGMSAKKRAQSRVSTTGVDNKRKSILPTVSSSEDLEQMNDVNRLGEEKKKVVKTNRRSSRQSILPTDVQFVKEEAAVEEQTPTPIQEVEQLSRLQSALEQQVPLGSFASIDESSLKSQVSNHESVDQSEIAKKEDMMDEPASNEEIGSIDPVAENDVNTLSSKVIVEEEVVVASEPIVTVEPVSEEQRPSPFRNLNDFDEESQEIRKAFDEKILGGKVDTFIDQNLQSSDVATAAATEEVIAPDVPANRLSTDVRNAETIHANKLIDVSRTMTTRSMNRQSHDPARESIGRQSKEMDSKNRRQSIIPSARKVDVPSRQQRMSSSASVPVDQPISIGIDAAAKLRTVVAETNAILARQNGQPIQQQPLQQRRDSNETPKFRGNWTPKVADPTPMSFVPRQKSLSTTSTTATTTGVLRTLNNQRVSGVVESGESSPSEDDDADASLPRKEEEEKVVPVVIALDSSSEKLSQLEEDTLLPANNRRAIPPMQTPATNTTRSMMTETEMSQPQIVEPQEGMIVDGYRVKTNVVGRGNVPGYMTPTESSRSKLRPKTPTTSDIVASARRGSSPNVRRTPTQPKAPVLATTQRRRSSSGQLQSSTTREMLKVKEEYQALLEQKKREQLQLERLAKSHPVVPHYGLTHPQPFVLETDKRIKSTNVPTIEFHSMAEIASTIFRRDVKPRGVQEEHHHPVQQHHVPIQPQSPHLHSAARSRKKNTLTTEEMELERLQKEMEEEQKRKERQRVLLERSMNSSSTTADSTMSVKKPLTQPMPFELKSVSRHERARQEFELQEQRRRKEEEERRLFKARPVPSNNPMNHHQATTAHELTVPIAPTCVERAMLAEQMHLNKLEMEKKELEKAREFHARPLPKTTYEKTFVVNPTDTLLVEPVAPALKTDERAERRMEFEQKKREQDRAAELQRLEMERLAKTREEEELREYRKSLVHKAKAVPVTSKIQSQEITHQEEFTNSLVDHPQVKQRPTLITLGGGAHRVAPVGATTTSHIV